MFIKLRENSEGVLAININTGTRIRLYERNKEYVMSVETEHSNHLVQVFQTWDDGFQVFNHMMDKLDEGCRVCNINRLM